MAIAAFAIAAPAFERLNATKIDIEREKILHPSYGRWLDNNLNSHKHPGYVSVTISLKPIGGAPGDATSEQMDAVADLAEKYSFNELRVTH